VQSESFNHKSKGTGTAKARFRKISSYLENTVGTVSAVCDCTYFSSGEEFFARFLHEAEKAQHSIYVEFFLIEKGVYWSAAQSLLMRKARADVDVRVVYDPLACITTLPRRHIREMTEAGIKVRAFRSPNINHRNHRKIIVIDGNTTLCGGVNLSDRYGNLIELFGHWKDSGLMMIERTGNTQCIPLFDTPHERVGEHTLLNLISGAEDYVWITSPYFMCGQGVRSALYAAALSGVDVRIILPYIADKTIVKAATESYYHELLTNKVRVFEYTQGFIHAKNIVSDDEIAMVGSINLDYRSLYLNYECGIVMQGEVVSDVANDFTETLKFCKEITFEDLEKVSIFKRACQLTCRIFAFFL
jgi:cardiolipin synthase